MVFYHLMRALGYTTRWVVDWTDHVWVEVEVAGRWVHIDPCEAAFDDKHMYLGWGKKHTYIVAFSGGGDDIALEDVTADYADDMAAVRRRRDLSDDDLALALQTAVAQWNDERQQSVTSIARCVAPRRRACALLAGVDAGSGLAARPGKAARAGASDSGAHARAACLRRDAAARCSVPSLPRPLPETATREQHGPAGRPMMRRGSLPSPRRSRRPTHSRPCAAHASRKRHAGAPRARLERRSDCPAASTVVFGSRGRAQGSITRIYWVGG